MESAYMFGETTDIWRKADISEESPICLVRPPIFGEVLICLVRPPKFGEKPIFLKKRRYVW